MNALFKFEILATWNCKLKNLLLKVSNTASASRFSLLDWETTGYKSAWGLPYRSLMVARIINLKNIWLFLSTRSLGNSSTSKDNHTKWIVEELLLPLHPVLLKGVSHARLPPMWPGFGSWRRRHMWVEFVVGFLPFSQRFFSGYFGFPLSLKTNTFKLQFTVERRYPFQRVLKNS